MEKQPNDALWTGVGAALGKVAGGITSLEEVERMSWVEFNGIDRSVGGWRQGDIGYEHDNH